MSLTAPLPEHMCVRTQEVSFAVAQPILQSALVVSGLLGIFVFGEISGPFPPLYTAFSGYTQHTALFPHTINCKLNITITPKH
eukprot:COSAG05_NODE_2617_length_2832_cov_3.361142_5_plen_83_part_00